MARRLSPRDTISFLKKTRSSLDSRPASSYSCQKTAQRPWAQTLRRLSSRSEDSPPSSLYFSPLFVCSIEERTKETANRSIVFACKEASFVMVHSTKRESKRRMKREDEEEEEKEDDEEEEEDVVESVRAF